MEFPILNKFEKEQKYWIS